MASSARQQQHIITYQPLHEYTFFCDTTPPPQQSAFTVPCKTLTLKVLSATIMSVTSPLTHVFIFALFAIATAAASQKCNGFKPSAKTIIERNGLAGRVGEDKLKELQKVLCKDGDCNVRLCFALDGSASISHQEFQTQKNLVKLIASVAAPGNASFSAVQYGLSNTFITGTTFNLAEFRVAVQNSTLAKARRTFLSAGIAFCISQVVSEPAGAGRKIVVLGDGRATFSEDSLPIVLAASGQADIYAVGIGFPRDSKRLLQITGGRKDRVIGISRYSEVVNVVPRLIRSLCNVPKPKKTTSM